MSSSSDADPTPGGMTRTGALLGLLGLFVVLFWPCLFFGEVIFPHDNAEEIGAARMESDPYPSNHKFSDTSSFYVPEVNAYLNGDHDAWLATWAPHVELGRPLGQVSGFSPAFLLTRVLSWTTHDPFVMLTRFTLLTLALTALFAFLFLEELGLSRAASFAASALLVFGPYSMYWVTCVLFASGWCWTFLLLWMVAGFVREATAWRALGIAFGSYALLMSGYPQQIVWHLYVLVPFALVRCWRFGGDGRVAKLAAIAACAAIGVACAAPVYADLALASRRSSRGGADHTFFLQTIQGANGTGSPALFLTQLFDAFWLGDPMDEARSFSGVTLTPFLCAGLAFCAIASAWRRAWPWLLVAAIGVAMGLSSALYLFGVDHLGLGISRYAPMAGALIPAAVAAAIGMDAALRRPAGEGPSRGRALAIVAACVLFALAAWKYAALDVPLRGGWIAVSVALFVAGLAALAFRRATLACWIAAVSVLVYGRPEILMRAESWIHTTSPLVARMHELVQGGERYAGIGDVVSRLLPPNQENLTGLSSIHSFNSLSSERYQAWVSRVSEIGARTYGRQFRKIPTEAKLGDGELAWAGVGWLVSEMELASSAVVPAGRLGTVWFYRPKEAPVLEAQFAQYERDGDAVRIAGSPNTAAKLALHRMPSRDDHLRFELTPSDRETILFVSQQHHPQWTATTDGRALETVIVNGFYQGVVVPPGTRTVDLVFRPWSLWSWIPHALFAFAALVCAWRTLTARSRAT